MAESEKIKGAAIQKLFEELRDYKPLLKLAVADTDYEGITGRIKFDAHGDRTGSVVVIYKVVKEGGKRFFKLMKF